MTDKRDSPAQTVLSTNEASASGALDQYACAWRTIVSRLRYVVIERQTNLSTDQLKVVFSHAGSFVGSVAHNLIDVRRLLSQGNLRLEPVPEEFAEAIASGLRDENVEARVEPLGDEEVRERLKLVNSPSEADSEHRIARAASNPNEASPRAVGLKKHSRTPPQVSPFTIVDEGAFLAALNSDILGAMQVRDLVKDMNRLNQCEQVFICLDTFFTEAEANGVGHFFYYDCADLYDQVLLGLEDIGAVDIRVRLERYVDQVFGGKVPTDISARQDAIDALDVDDDDRVERMVGDLSAGISSLAAWARANESRFRVR